MAGQQARMLEENLRGHRARTRWLMLLTCTILVVTPFTPESLDSRVLLACALLSGMFCIASSVRADDARAAVANARQPVERSPDPDLVAGSGDPLFDMIDEMEEEVSLRAAAFEEKARKKEAEIREKRRWERHREQIRIMSSHAIQGEDYP